MKTYRAKFVLILFTVFLAAVGMARAGAEARQPHMEAALHFLQDAKKSDTPVQLLKSAREQLHKAVHDKHGFRVVSLEIVDKAIEAAETGDTQKMIEKIDAAIANVHDAMAHAPGSR